jgi:hypothetical protein
VLGIFPQYRHLGFQQTMGSVCEIAASYFVFVPSSTGASQNEDSHAYIESSHS